MNNFITKYRHALKGILTGFDRLVFKGLLSNLNYTKGMMAFLFNKSVLLKDFDKYVEKQTGFFKSTTKKYIEQSERPYYYLNSSKTRKDQIAKDILNKDKTCNGLICSLGTVEPCLSYRIYKNNKNHKLELVKDIRKCLHYYHYLDHPVFGFMSIRFQTWFPFDIQICINGREFLKKQLDLSGIGYHKQDNCFLDIENLERAQELMQSMLQCNYPELLNSIVEGINPFYKTNLNNQMYYWTIHQSEWATDLMFQSSKDLQEIYSPLIKGAMCAFSSHDVMRFLGKKLHGNFKGEVISNLKKRPEGVRIKHIIGKNSVKMYDKKGQILRIETTINDPSVFKVFRKPQNSDNEICSWMPLRKSVTDIYRRSQVCDASNLRFLTSLASLDTDTPLNKLVDDVCKPAKLHNKRVRALRPWDTDDMNLLKSINKGEFNLNGFKNKDIRECLYSEEELNNESQKKKLSSATSRKLRLLRAHGIISKVNKTHRYIVTDKGKKTISAILQYQNITLEQLHNIAA